MDIQTNMIDKPVDMLTNNDARRMIIVAGVPQNGQLKKWKMEYFDTLVTATSMRTGTSYALDLASPLSVDVTLNSVALQEPEDYYIELVERLRTEHNFVRGGNSKLDTTINPELRQRRMAYAPVHEEKKIKYHHGRRRIVEVRSVVGEKKPSSDAQKKAAENARQYANTPEARANRIMSMNGRKSEEITRKFDPSLFADDE